MHGLRSLSPFPVFLEYRHCKKKEEDGEDEVAEGEGLETINSIIETVRILRTVLCILCVLIHLILRTTL